jgi:hypothetical protein
MVVNKLAEVFLVDALEVEFYKRDEKRIAEVKRAFRSAW